MQSKDRAGQECAQVLGGRWEGSSAQHVSMPPSLQRSCTAVTHRVTYLLPLPSQLYCDYVWHIPTLTKWCRTPNRSDRDNLPYDAEMKAEVWMLWSVRVRVCVYVRRQTC